MKKPAFIVLPLLLFLGVGVSPSQERGLGAGIMIGEPTGIKGKIWLNRTQALDFGFGWSVSGFNLDRYDADVETGSRFHFHADFLWHDFRLIQTRERLPVYYGFGFRRNSGKGFDDAYGIRGVVGIAWLLRNTPADIFLEATPVFQLNPSTRIGLNGGVGARYFF